MRLKRQFGAWFVCAILAAPVIWAQSTLTDLEVSFQAAPTRSAIFSGQPADATEPSPSRSPAFPFQAALATPSNGQIGLLAMNQVSPAPQNPDADELRIIIVEGEGGTNNIRLGSATKPVVEVRDRNNRPVAGALVTFTLPESGPSATFVDGSRFLTVSTDASGRASVGVMQPNNVAGQFKINVTASKEGMTTSTTITQTNLVGAAATAGTAGAAATGLSIGAKIAIIGAIAAAAVLAGVCGSGNCGNETRTTPIETQQPALRIGIGGGSPVFGPPGQR